jgi:hypothetical protein
LLFLLVVALFAEREAVTGFLARGDDVATLLKYGDVLPWPRF